MLPVFPVERALEISRDLDIRQGKAETLGNLGDVARIRGEYDRAQELLQQARDLAGETDSPSELAVSRARLADLSRARNEYDRAGEHVQAALDCLDGLSGVEAARVRVTAGRLALDRSRPEAARERGERGREACAATGARHWEARFRLLFGRAAAQRVDPETAREHWREALDTFEDVGAPQDALDTLRHLVETCRQRGDDDRAAEWMQRAETLCADAPEAVADQHRDWLDRGAARADD